MQARIQLLVKGVFVKWAVVDGIGYYVGVTTK